MWKVGSKHKKLSEELALQNCREEDVEVDNDVVTFKLKYLGNTVVEKVIGEKIGPEAVKSILKVAKASRKKLTPVNLNISLKGIAVTDLQGNDMFKVSIYRISNCSTDASHRQVFSFISTDNNETTECHAFLCSKRKIAETVTLSVAHAFSTAYAAWRILPSTREFAQIADQEETAKENNDNTLQHLIDLDESSLGNQQQQNPWVSFEDDFSASPSHHSFNKDVDLIVV